MSYSGRGVFIVTAQQGITEEAIVCQLMAAVAYCGEIFKVYSNWRGS
ncbi:hypothetical protein [Photobacterium carnosum]|nr:hypothetical protein [Photobacterium carnosum]MCD9495186.1 hypothetical protein [Photobacterium carnosum]MCD9498744.1 hypothetical protein [Photobacterium carnosum]MCD9543057.1 hypothetical protein [Photobacterium carnosum]